MFVLLVLVWSLMFKIWRVVFLSLLFNIHLMSLDVEHNDLAVFWGQFVLKCNNQVLKDIKSIISSDSLQNHSIFFLQPIIKFLSVYPKGRVNRQKLGGSDRERFLNYVYSQGKLSITSSTEIVEDAVLLDMFFSDLLSPAAILEEIGKSPLYIVNLPWIVFFNSVKYAQLSIEDSIKAAENYMENEWELVPKDLRGIFYNNPSEPRLFPQELLETVRHSCAQVRNCVIP